MSDSSRSRGGPPSYALTQAEREFLRSGETGGYRKSRLESQIQSKLHDQPARLVRLAEDIELLADRIDTDVRQHFLSGISTYPIQQDEPLKPTELHGRSMLRSPYSELGRELGDLIHQIIQPTRHDDEHDILSQIVFGFISGTFIDHLPIKEIDQKGFEHFIREVMENCSEFASEIDDQRLTYPEWSEENQEITQRWDMKKNEIESNVRHILTEADVLYKEDTDLLSDPGEWDDLLSNPDKIRNQREEYRNSRSYKVVDETVNYLIADNIDPEFVAGSLTYSTAPGSAGNWAAFMDSNDIDSFTVDEFASEERVLEIFRKFRIKGRIQLKSRLVSDADRLQHHHWRGVDAINIIDELRSGETPLSSREIAISMESRKNRVSQVTAAAHALAGNPYKNQITWDETPLLKGDKTGWELTEYGDLLATYISLDSLAYDPLADLPEKSVRVVIDQFVEEGLFERSEPMNN